jgi:hypothetical protein
MCIAGTANWTFANTSQTADAKAALNSTVTTTYAAPSYAPTAAAATPTTPAYVEPTPAYVAPVVAAASAYVAREYPIFSIVPSARSDFSPSLRRALRRALARVRRTHSCLHAALHSSCRQGDARCVVVVVVVVVVAILWNRYFLLPLVPSLRSTPRSPSDALLTENGVAGACGKVNSDSALIVAIDQRMVRPAPFPPRRRHPLTPLSVSTTVARTADVRSRSGPTLEHPCTRPSPTCARRASRPDLSTSRRAPFPLSRVSPLELSASRGCSPKKDRFLSTSIVDSPAPASQPLLPPLLHCAYTSSA